MIERDETCPWPRGVLARCGQEVVERVGDRDYCAEHASLVFKLRNMAGVFLLHAEARERNGLPLHRVADAFSKGQYESQAPQSIDLT